jgi:AcrR family transcriptional regulator
MKQAQRGAGAQGPAPSSRRVRRRTEVRERLYREALRLFAERGYERTTVEHITEAADVGKGTFFNYFPTKEHVLARLGEDRLKIFALALEEARAGKRAIPEILSGTAHRLAMSRGYAPELMRSIFVAHATSAPVREQLHQSMQRCRRMMTEIIGLGQQRGAVRRDMDAARLSRILQQVFMGVTLTWALNPETPLEKCTSEVWELLWTSLGQRAVRREESKR